MRHHLNYPLLGSLILGSLLAGAGVHLLHGFQVRRTAGVLRSRAEAVGREGRRREELDLLRRYLTYRPEDTDALERYGLLLAQHGVPEDRSRALETLERVLARDPGRLTTRREAARLARGLGQLEAARTHYLILNGSPAGGDADAEEALGRIEDEAGRHADAAAWLTKAIGRDPTRVDAFALLARLLRARLQQPDRADRVMDARQVEDGLIAKNPGSARAYLARALYRRQQAIPGDADDIREALKLAPDDPDVLLVAAADSPPEEAIRLLDRGIAARPDEPRLFEAIALFEARAGHRDRAIDRLRQGILRRPDERNLRWLLAELEIDDGRDADAAKEIGRLRSDGFPAPPLDFLEARLLVAARRWTEAARALAATAPTLEIMAGGGGLAKRAFLLLSRCQDRLGNPDMRYGAARRAVALDVADPGLAVSAHSELAAALADLGKLDEAAEEYRIALRMPGAPDGLRVELGRVLVSRNLQLPAARRQWEEVERVLAESGGDRPDSAALAVLKAEVLAGRERLQEAGDRLARAETAHPDDPALRVARAVLADRRGQPGEALAILEAARARLGDRPELLAASIHYWSGRPAEAAARSLEQLDGPVGAVADEAARRSLRLALADGLDRAGEPGRASAIRDRLADEQPDHLGVRLAQLDSALRSGRLEAGREVVDEVRRIEGAEGSLWRYGQALILIQGARRSRDLAALDQARSLLTEARGRRPGWARVLLAGAEVDDLRGDPGSALRGYLEALEKGERDPIAVRRAVQLLYRRGRYSQADALLRQVQQDAPLSLEMTRMAADVALQVRDEGRAIALARRAVAGAPDSAADQTWLGQLLFAAAAKAAEQGRAEEAGGRRGEAERALARGIELAPGDPDARAALILALAAWGRVDEAREAIRAAEGSLRGPAAGLAIARCFEAIGEQAEADARYREALRGRPEDVATLQAAATSALKLGKVADAEPLLRRLIDLRSKSPAEAAWARRVLALALSIEGRGGSSKVRDLLGLDEAPSSASMAIEDPAWLSAEDIRTRARVYARQPGRSPRRKALEALDALIARDEGNPADLFLRAQLLAADGDWKRARAQAEDLLVANRANPALLEFLARGEIIDGHPELALPRIDALDGLRPGSTAAVELRARVLFAAGRRDESIGLLADLARKEPALGPKVASILDELGRPADAESVLRVLEASSPKAEVRAAVLLALAGLLGRHGRHAEAIATCEQLWDDPGVDPGRVAQVALVALYVGQPGPEVLDRVEARISSASVRKPGDIVLRFCAANLAILRGRYAEAESKLCDLRRAAPESGAPLNNLAWLLALRGGRGPEPLDLVDQAIALEGPQPDSLDTRGLIQALGGRPDLAVRDLEESIASAPSPTTYFHLALALSKAGRPADAAEALAKARSSGLKAGDVHPLERPILLELEGALTEK